MRGVDEQFGLMFSYVSLQDRVPVDHPLRAIRQITDRALSGSRPSSGCCISTSGGRRCRRRSCCGDAAARALHDPQRAAADGAIGLQSAVPLVRGLGIDDAVWLLTMFSKNRDRLLTGDIAAAFLEAVLRHAETERLLSDDHFTVDGTLLKAWASQQGSSAARSGSRPRWQAAIRREISWERRRNDMHQSTTDPDARLYQKAQGREAQLGYLGHVLMEHRSGLIVDAPVTPADGLANGMPPW